MELQTNTNLKQQKLLFLKYSRYFLNNWKDTGLY